MFLVLSYSEVSDLVKAYFMSDDFHIWQRRVYDRLLSEMSLSSEKDAIILDVDSVDLTNLIELIKRSEHSQHLLIPCQVQREKALLLECSSN